MSELVSLTETAPEALLRQILDAAERGELRLGEGDYYSIRSVRYDGVQSVRTDSGALRSTAGDHGRRPHFARVSNIPRRGPAWWRLVVDCQAYAIPSAAREAIVALGDAIPAEFVGGDP